MKRLLAEVREAIDAAFPHCELAEPKVFRIFRDVRFSKDKSPYKTHIGGFLPLARKGKKATDLPMALYFHVGADESFGAAGHYMMEPESLDRFRRAVADDKKGKELEKLLAALARKGFASDSHERCSECPRASTRTTRAPELLKRKGLVVSFPDLPAGLVAKPGLVKWVADACKTAAPFVEWLAFATA